MRLVAFRDLSFKNKIWLYAGIASGISLLLACGSFLFYDVLTFRKALVHELSSTADIIGTTGASSLAFYDKEFASRILAGLEAHPHVIAACIYDTSGSVFAEYQRGQGKHEFPGVPGKASHHQFQSNALYRFHNNFFDVFRPVVFGGSQVGIVHIRSDLSELSVRFQRYFGIVLGVMSVSLLLSLLLSARFQRTIMRSVTTLEQTARIVSEQKDYSARAEKHGDDELGVLTDTFNEMLTQINIRDLERRSHLRFLESIEQIHKSLRKATHIEEMMDEVLETTLSIFNCDRAWLLYPCDPEAPSWRIQMERTKPEYPGASALHKSFSMTTNMAERFRKLLRSEEPVAAEFSPGELDWDPEDKYSIRSSMSVALKPKVGKPWAFGLHQCSQERAWTEEEQRLFKEIGRRIAESLSSLLSLRDLQGSEEKLRSTMASMDDLVFVLSKEGAFEDYSPIGNRADLYLPPEAFLGKPYREVMPPEVTKEFDVAINAIMAAGEVQQVEYSLEISQQTRWYSAKASVRKDSAGEFAGVTVVSRDITARKRAEEETAALEEHLRQAQKMEAIGTLAGGIAHDFNNILGVIVGNTELAMHDLPEWNRSRKNLEEVLIACLRARDMVKQILSFSRQTEHERKPLRISQLIKEALKMLRYSLPATVDIRQDISAHSDIVLADPTQINQIIINLCTNAAHAMRETGGGLEVSLKNADLNQDAASFSPDLDPGSYLIITVSDTGHGIGPEVIERIFDPYFTTKAVGEGTGMGLSMVHGIVKSHRGTVLVESEPGKGTTFEIYLPLAKEPVTEPAKSEVDDHPPLPTGTEHILFVDDEKALAELGEHMLSHMGYQVTSRTSSIEALEAFRAQPDKFDLVMTDMTMPNMAGTDLSGEILKIRQDIPIILCSGFSEMVTEAAAKNMGIKAFVMKPMAIREIAVIVRRILDQKETNS